MSLPDRIETRIEDHHENLSITMPHPDEAKIDEKFTLSGTATPAQDTPDTGIFQIDAADIELELNNLLTIDSPNPYPSMVADPTANLESAATTSIQDLPSDQPEE